MKQQPEQRSFVDDMKNSYLITMALCQMFSYWTEMLFRSPGTVGKRAHGVLGFVSHFVAFPLAASHGMAHFNAPQDEWILIGSYWLLIIVLTMNNNKRRKEIIATGIPIHSRSSGISRLGDGSINAKMYKEPLVAMIIGGCLCPFSLTLGLMVIFSGMCLGFASCYEYARMEHIKQSMMDAEAEGQWMQSLKDQ